MLSTALRAAGNSVRTSDSVILNAVSVMCDIALNTGLWAKLHAGWDIFVFTIWPKIQVGIQNLIVNYRNALVPWMMNHALLLDGVRLLEGEFPVVVRQVVISQDSQLPSAWTET